MENTGQGGNDIFRAEIYIPLPEFTTNGISVSSSMISNSYITLLSNRIRLDYQSAGSNITPGDFDAITIKIFDTLANGWANVTWDILCEFNTSSGQYIDTGTHFGWSKDLAIIMPDAEASAYISPAIIYAISQSNILTYVITNKGFGTDRIFKARISIPSEFTQIAEIQNSFIGDDIF